VTKYIILGALVIVMGLATCFAAYIAAPAISFLKIFVIIFIIFSIGLWVTSFLANKFNENIVESVKANDAIRERVRDRIRNDLAVGTQGIEHRLSQSEIIAIGNFCKMILEEEFARINYAYLKWYFRFMFLLQLILLLFIVVIGCS